MSIRNLGLALGLASLVLAANGAPAIGGGLDLEIYEPARFSSWEKAVDEASEPARTRLTKIEVDVNPEAGTREAEVEIVEVSSGWVQKILSKLPTPRQSPARSVDPEDLRDLQIYEERIHGQGDSTLRKSRISMGTAKNQTIQVEFQTKILSKLRARVAADPKATASPVVRVGREAVTQAIPTAQEMVGAKSVAEVALEIGSGAE